MHPFLKYCNHSRFFVTHMSSPTAPSLVPCGCMQNSAVSAAAVLLGCNNSPCSLFLDGAAFTDNAHSYAEDAVNTSLLVPLSDRVRGEVDRGMEISEGVETDRCLPGLDTESVDAEGADTDRCRLPLNLYPNVVLWHGASF